MRIYIFLITFPVNICVHFTTVDFHLNKYKVQWFIIIIPVCSAPILFTNTSGRYTIKMYSLLYKYSVACQTCRDIIRTFRHKLRILPSPISVLPTMFSSFSTKKTNPTLCILVRLSLNLLLG